MNRSILGRFLFAFVVLSLSTTINAQEQEQSQEREIFKVVEAMPRFPGCENIEGSVKDKEACAKEKMLMFVYSNIKYPEQARVKKVEGMCVVQFIVSKEGKIEEIKAVRDIGAGTGDEAVRVMEMMNDMEEKWIPGHQRDRAVDVLYTLPIRFRLTDNVKP